MKFVDGTVEPLVYNERVCGFVGRDHEMIRTPLVFYWAQNPIRAKDAYGMSVGLFDLLTRKDVAYVYVGGEYDDTTQRAENGRYTALGEIRNMDVLSKDSDFFTNDIEEDQYLVR
jgi:hypothetical protein